MNVNDKAPTIANIDLPAITVAMMATNPVATKGWLDIISESKRFVNNRLQENMNAQSAMLACKSPGELLQVQAEFYEIALAQYAEEFTSLYRMISTTTINTAEDARTGHARRYDDIPL